MKLPGCATLEFRLEPENDRITWLHQISEFVPRGLAGILYWHAVDPLHRLVFSGMLEGIARATNKTLVAGPERVYSGNRFPETVDLPGDAFVMLGWTTPAFLRRSGKRSTRKTPRGGNERTGKGETS